jgi:prevent-host-death family protein
MNNIANIGAFEAKTHFSEIISDVENGSDYIITKRGKPVAKIIPFQQDPQMTFSEAVKHLQEMRKRYKGKPGSFSIRKAIDEGRP